MSPPLAALLEAEGLAAYAAKLAAAGVETIEDLVQLSETELKHDVGLALMHAKKLTKAAKAKAKAAKAKAEAEAAAAAAKAAQRAREKERLAAEKAAAAAAAAEAKAAAAAPTKKKELSAEEQKKQNEALFDAARYGEMGKFKAAIAAGAEVDWHNPDRVSELSELE